MNADTPKRGNFKYMANKSVSGVACPQKLKEKKKNYIYGVNFDK